LPPEIIKVCGLTQLADAALAVRHGATAAGFIFHSSSPRYVRPIDAALLAATVPAGVLKVGVFVDAAPDEIRNTVSAARLDVVQLHGDEPPEFCAELSKAVRVWKVFPVDETFDAAALQDYPADAFLLDAPRLRGAHGGTGRTFPWPLALEAKKYGRVIVSGGLSGDNVAEAIRKVDPWGVDAASRLERAPGVKDPDKLRSYLEAARSAGPEAVTPQAVK